MISCTCIVQEGQTPDRHEKVLREKLSTFVRASFAEDSQFNWVRVPAGNGFTAGNPSTSSIVSMAASSPLVREDREKYLRELVTLWTSTNHCSADEIVAVLADPAQY